MFWSFPQPQDLRGKLRKREFQVKANPILITLIHISIKVIQTMIPYEAKQEITISFLKRTLTLPHTLQENIYILQSLKHTFWDQGFILVVGGGKIWGTFSRNLWSILLCQKFCTFQTYFFTTKNNLAQNPSTYNWGQQRTNLNSLV